MGISTFGVIRKIRNAEGGEGGVVSCVIEEVGRVKKKSRNRVTYFTNDPFIPGSTISDLGRINDLSLAPFSSSVLAIDGIELQET